MLAFVDTNILIYALDPRDIPKQLAAQAWPMRCWQERIGRVRVQVVNEFDVNLIGDESLRRSLKHLPKLATLDLAFFETDGTPGFITSDHPFDCNDPASAI